MNWRSVPGTVTVDTILGNWIQFPELGMIAVIYHLMLFVKGIANNFPVFPVWFSPGDQYGVRTDGCCFYILWCGGHYEHNISIKNAQRGS